MDKLFAWLRVEPTKCTLWLFFVKTVALIFFVEFLFGTLLDILGAPLRDETTLLPSIKESPFIWLFVVIPILAFLEELCFRLPLALFTAARVHPVTILAVAIGLSAIFGYAHGGWWQIPLQGTSGFIFCVVFLKCGGLQKKYVKALFSSSSVHLLSNWIALALMGIWGM